MMVSHFQAIIRGRCVVCPPLWKILRLGVSFHVKTATSQKESQSRKASRKFETSENETAACQDLIRSIGSQHANKIPSNDEEVG